ncbi:MAG: dTMP kinase [Rubrobacter sp.]|nr:dTMP kinase [Rubrobacter sp.]
MPAAGWRPSPLARGGETSIGGPGRGVFVTVEGVDFSGKSTLVRHLKSIFAGPESGLPGLYFTREPGGTPAAERIRGVLLDPGLEMEPWTEAYLYAAARADHVRREILPRLEAGQSVLCERYLHSSLAYQGAGRGLGMEEVRSLNGRAAAGAVPDRTFYLRLGAEERALRGREAGTPLDRLESAGDDFARRVEEGFEELVLGEPGRIRALDARRPPEELAQEVRQEILSLHRAAPGGTV